MKEKQLTNQILIDAIEDGKSVYPKLEANLKNKFINGLIYLVDRISDIKPCPFNRMMLIDFIEAIAVFPDSKFDVLIKPVTDIMVYYLRNSNYQAHLTEGRIKGDDIIKISNMDMPVTAEKIIEHIKENNMFVLTPKDVDIAKLDYQKYWNELSGIKSDTNNKKIVQSKWVAPVFALFLYYLMNGKYEKFTHNLDDIKNLCEKYEYYKSPLNIQKTIQSIGTSGDKDPLKKQYIFKIITLLDEMKIYPISLNLASNDYVSIIQN